MDTRRTEYDIRRWYSSGVPSTYLASRPLLGRDGQDSEGAEENRQGSVLRMNNTDPTVCRTSDHEDSRRLATGLTADLSSPPGAGTQRSYPVTDRSALERQTDPSDRRTSNWRSSTLGSDTAAPSTGRPMCGSPTLIGSSSAPHRQMQQDVGFEREHVPLRGAERDPLGNASRILMTGLRHPGQRGMTTWMANWVGPIIPNRLMMLLSGTDNRRNRLGGYSGRTRITHLK